MPQLDPTWEVGLLSSDFGNVYTPDGREHPVLGITPVGQTVATPSISATTAPAQTANVGLGPFSSINPFSGIGSLLTDHHIGARVIVGIVGIGLVFIVALRLTR
jgi:hypothetical protein